MPILMQLSAALETCAFNSLGVRPQEAMVAVSERPTDMRLPVRQARRTARGWLGVLLRRICIGRILRRPTAFGRLLPDADSTDNLQAGRDPIPPVADARYWAVQTLS